MAFLHCLTLLLLSSLSLLATATQYPRQMNSLGVPVKKDAATGLHVATLQKRTPSVAVALLVDLNAPITTVNCQAGGRPYLSSRYEAPLCYSTQCSRAAGPHHPCLACRGSYPGCHNNTCGVAVSNPITRATALGELAQDSLSLLASSAGGAPSTLPQFLFVCAPKELLSRGLPQRATGALSLGHSHNSLPNQAASHLGFPPKFSTCLPRGYGNGTLFLGDVPNSFPGGIDVSSKLQYAPLSVSAEGDYGISLNGIRINNKVVRTSLTRATISTTVPYSILEHTLYAAVTRFFANQMGRVPRVSPVAPFGVCFESGRVAGTRVGPAVPPIDLVVAGRMGSTWRITGANSMVEARPGVTCLAFVDGGRSPGRGAMVIGAYQLEDNLVQFDLAKSILGFSSSLLFQRTSCSNFNYAT